MPLAFNPWEMLDAELERPVGAGGGMFCGVSEEQFAINGVTYAWPKGSKLKWGIAFSRLGHLSDMDCKDAITAALKEISDCCDITHEYVSNPLAANLKITTQRLDGPNGVLADCQIPVGNVSVDTTQLLMRLDDGEQWVLSENPQPGTIDFYRVFLHESEHGHGLGHKPPSVQAPALIAPIYSPVIRHLQEADKAELVRRYGVNVPSPVPQPPVPVPGGSPITATVTIAQSGKKWSGEVTLARVV